MKTLRLLLIMLMGLMPIAACDDGIDPISHRYPCSFLFYYDLHPGSLLFSAYKSAGTFVYAYLKTDGSGLRRVMVQSSDGKTATEENVLSAAKELPPYNPLLLGAVNEIGLIVGCTNFDGPTAFDRICPNCVTYQALRWAANRQHVECTKCKREYDLNTGSVVSGAQGDILMRYAIFFDGTRMKINN